MTHEEYRKKLKQLTDELQAAGNIRPYDPDNYNRIVDELNALIQTTLEPPARPASPKPKSKLVQRYFCAPRQLKEKLRKAVTSCRTHPKP